MKDLATIPRVDGAFPNVTIRPETAPGAKDGTPLHSQWGDELFGALQAIVNGASLTPSGTEETCGPTPGDVTGSQIVEAMQLMFSVPGEIVAYPSDTIPAGARLLKLSGTLASRTYLITGKYSRLLNVWVGAVDNADPSILGFFRTSDAGGTTRNAAGNYFVLPIFDGVFLRGRDLGHVYDPDGATREFGDVQAFAMQQHTHDKIYMGVDELLNSSGAGTDKAVVYEAKAGTSLETGDVGAGPFTDTETRPVNQAVTWCIRY